MTFLDIFLMIMIVGGAFLILYRTLWKKKGCCGDTGCGGCSSKKQI